MLATRAIRRVPIFPNIVSRSLTRGYANAHHVDVIKPAAVDFLPQKQHNLKRWNSDSRHGKLTEDGFATDSAQVATYGHEPTPVSVPKASPVVPRTKNAAAIQEPQHAITPPLALRPSVVEMLTPTMKKFTLQNKVAVVTGAARGLGYNMAQALSQSGAKAIAILDMRPELGAESAAELHNGTGIPVKYYNVDIRDESLVSAAVANVVQDFGSVDVLINSAGIAE
jgi:hypothetical protein